MRILVPSDLPWKRRSNSTNRLHHIMSRPGSMPPALAAEIIRRFTTPGDLIFDPFCGKGTVLLESALLGRQAVGLDVAPDAVLAARAKTKPPTVKQIDRFLEHVRLRYRRRRVPWRVRVFFSRDTLRQILAFRDCLVAKLANGTPGERQVATFLLGLLLGLLHGHSRLSLSLPCSHSFAMAPSYVRKYAKKHGLKRPSRSVKACLRERAKELLGDLAGVTLAHTDVLLGSAKVYSKKLVKLTAGQVDLILTSPPYLNVQTYPKDSWLRLWVLGFDYKSLRTQFIETGSPKRYLNEMRACLVNMLQVLKGGGAAVIVAGDAPYKRRGKKLYFRTATQVGRIAGDIEQDGYTFEVRSSILDSIPSHSRYYSAVHKDGKKSVTHKDRRGVRYERILVLKKVKRSKSSTSGRRT